MSSKSDSLMPQTRDAVYKYSMPLLSEGSNFKASFPGGSRAASICNFPDFVGFLRSLCFA